MATPGSRQKSRLCRKNRKNLKQKTVRTRFYSKIIRKETRKFQCCTRCEAARWWVATRINTAQPRLSLQRCEASGSTWPNSICSLIRNKTKNTPTQHGLSTPSVHRLLSLAPSVISCICFGLIDQLGPFLLPGSLHFIQCIVLFWSRRVPAVALLL